MGTAIRTLVLLISLALAGMAGGAAFWWLYAAPGAAGPAELPAPVPVDAVPLSRLTLSPLVDRAAPAVVNIAVLHASPLEQNPLLRDPYYRFFSV